MKAFSPNPKGRQKARLWLLAFSLLLTGCTTMDIARREEVAQVRTSVSEELIGVREDINTLNGRIQELQFKINELSQKQLQQSHEVNTALNDVKKQTTNINSRFKTLEKKQNQDKNDLQKKLNTILEEVTKENRELRTQIEALRKSTAYTGTEGYYVVAEGDTLSVIAHHFGISIRSIMEANDIPNPNAIRIGQKLIIPERSR